MHEVNLELTKREVTGKRVKDLRKDGLVPAVIHDHGKASVIVQGDYQAVHAALHAAGKHSPVTVKANGHTYTTLIKQVTFDPRYHAISHIVFNAVSANEKVDTQVPVRPRYAEGNEASPAERAGLMVLHNIDSVDVQAIASQLPDALFYDAEKLVEAGDHITVADLIVGKGIEVKTEPNQTLASVFEPGAVAAANDALGGDAEADAQNVASDHESGAEEGTQKDEIRPGGKKGFEDKAESHEPSKK